MSQRTTRALHGAFGSLISRERARTLYEFVSSHVLASRTIRHSMPSLVCSPDDAVTNGALVRLVAEAAIAAESSEVKAPVANRDDSVFFNVFPGEHYRLLKAMAGILKPDQIVEVGTYTGMGTVALAQGCPGASLYTYDVLPWNHFPSHLTEGDFKGGRVHQVLGDLSDPAVFERNVDILNGSGLIFVDAPKDGRFEYRFLPMLSRLSPMKRRILVLDDIRFVNMIDLWRSIKSPKLDATSFGHWSGTGIVDISDGLALG